MHISSQHVHRRRNKINHFKNLLKPQPYLAQHSLPTSTHQSSPHPTGSRNPLSPDFLPHPRLCLLSFCWTTESSLQTIFSRKIVLTGSGMNAALSSLGLPDSAPQILHCIWEQGVGFTEHDFWSGWQCWSKLKAREVFIEELGERVETTSFK